MIEDMGRAWLNEHPHCAECERQGIVHPANEVDHIKPLSWGGADEEKNRQSLCERHHSAKTWVENHCNKIIIKDSMV